MTKPPLEITTAHLEVVVMPNGEVICAGKTVGWVTGRDALGQYLFTNCAEAPAMRRLVERIASCDNLRSDAALAEARAVLARTN